MTLNNASPGPSYVAAYQVSGLPFVTSSIAISGSVTQIDFPYITSFFTLKNTSSVGSLIAGFTSNGVILNGVKGTNNFTLGTSASFSGNIRIKSLFITATSGSVGFELIAGLTLIATRDFPVLTGSAIPPANPTGSFGFNGLG